MQTPPNSASPSLPVAPLYANPVLTPADRLRPHWPALLLGMLTLLFGFGQGIVFGVAEDSVKQTMQASADAVLAEHYGNDQAKAKVVLDKAWSYQQRSHLHAGGLGAASLVLVALLALVTPASRVTRGAGLVLAIGTLGYPIFWMVAGYAAPGLGGTGVAKEAVAWLGMSTSGAIVVGTIAIAALVTRALVKPQHA